MKRARLASLPVLILMYLAAFQATAQGMLINDSFDGYTAGQTLCTQAPSFWTTWNNGPGTAEDPIVSDSIAFDGTRSLRINGTNDAVLLLGNKTSGRYRVSLELFIPSGRAGYAGFLRTFAGTGSNWGLECFFQPDSIATLVTGGGIVTPVNYHFNRWFPVAVNIDLDNDHAEVYMDTAMVLEFQWTSSSTGSGAPNTLAALDLFAWPGSEGTPWFYIDQVGFQTLQNLQPPLNLTASVSGDSVTVTWEPPDTAHPEGYRLYRDSAVLQNLVTGPSFLDPDVYPGAHEYYVKAIYAAGMSAATEPATAVVAGGTPRNFVLVETATATWCTYCPGSAMGADDLVANGKQVAVIEYHDNDPYAFAGSNERNSYYGVTGLPTTQFDGGNTIAGGSAVTSLYPEYLPIYNAQINRLSLFTLSLGIVQENERSIHATATCERIYPYTNHIVKLRFVLIESHIPEAWQGTMDELNFVCRALYPSAQGTPLDFTNGGPFTEEYEITIDTAYNIGNCQLIAFLQDDQTKEVLQVDKAELNPFGIGETHSGELRISPNPADRVVIVQGGNSNTNLPATLRFYDFSGREAASFYWNGSGSAGNYFEADVQNIPQGLYFLVLTRGSQSSTGKLAILH